MATIAVLDPGGEPRTVPLSLAPRPVDLSGKVVGFLNNGKADFDWVYERLSELLRAEGKVAGVVRLRKNSYMQGAPREILEELAERCDLVVNGIGD